MTNPRWCSAALSLAGVLSSLLLCLALTGCAQPPRPTVTASPSPVRTTTSTAAADPSMWIGRWQGQGVRRLDIEPAPGADTYRLVFRNDQGITVTHAGHASGGRLFYEGGGRDLALRAGTGAETDDPDMQTLAQCLIVVPGQTGYCRRADTADALALEHGAYVAVRSACDEAAPADTVFFDGRVLGRPSQPACTTRVVSQQGMVFSLADRCVASPGAANGFNETATVPDPHHLALSPLSGPTRLYRYCATGLLPPGLRALAPQ